MTFLWPFKLLKVMHPPDLFSMVWWLVYPFRYSGDVNLVSLNMTTSGFRSLMSQSR